jgi:hypothetical protein
MGRELRDVNSKDIEDTDMLKVYVSRYWKIIQTNVIDMVPKIVVTFMVKKFMKKSAISMQSQIVPSTAEQVIDLLSDDP